MVNDLNDHYNLLVNPESFFNLVDVDKDDIIEIEELKAALQNKNYPITDKLIDVIKLSCDTDQDGKIQKKEFVKYCEM